MQASLSWRRQRGASLSGGIAGLPFDRYDRLQLLVTEGKSLEAYKSHQKPPYHVLCIDKVFMHLTDFLSIHARGICGLYVNDSRLTQPGE